MVLSMNIHVYGREAMYSSPTCAVVGNKALRVGASALSIMADCFSILDCVLLCLGSDLCKSVNYKAPSNQSGTSEGGLCELMPQTAAGDCSDIQTDPGFTHLTKVSIV